MASRKSRAAVFAAYVFLVPFLILGSLVFVVRLGVMMHVQVETNAWVSLVSALCCTMLFSFFLLVIIQKKASGKKKLKKGFRKKAVRWIMILTGAFGLYAVFFLSASNAKTTMVQEEYPTLHPVVRLAVGTVTLFDRDAVITDMARTHGDYLDMGLAQKKRSLHFVQADGYVHAVDFRTNGRSALRNVLLEWYFKLMGFNTLRHNGTGDHLHISLKSWENESGI